MLLQVQNAVLVVKKTPQNFYQCLHNSKEQRITISKKDTPKSATLPSCSLHDKWQFFSPRQQNVTTLASSPWPSGEKFELYPRHSTKRR